MKSRTKTPTSKHVTIKDLPDLSGNTRATLLQCPHCGAQFSAHRGDYFHFPGNTVIRCECGTPAALVRQLTTLQRLLG